MVALPDQRTIVDMDRTAVWTPIVSQPDLILEREGHCSATAAVRRLDSLRPSNGLDKQDRVHFAVVLGGFVDGGFEPTAVAAEVTSSTSTSLSWHVCGSSSVCEVDGMSAIADDQQQCFWLFGGMDGETYTPRNALYRASWTLCDDGDDTEISWKLDLKFSDPVELVGSFPSPRYRHASAFCPQTSRMFVFGGVTDCEEQTNDLYCLHTVGLVWTRVTLPDGAVIPRPRFLPVMIAVSAADYLKSKGDANTTMLVVYGGAHFNGGQQESLSDVWALGVASSRLNAVAPDVGMCCSEWQCVVEESRGALDGQLALPCVNGHCGLLIAAPSPQPQPTEDPSPAASSMSQQIECVYFGGKDFMCGSNRVHKLLLVASIVGLNSCTQANSSDAPQSRHVTLLIDSVRVTEFAVTGHTDDDIRNGGGHDMYTSDGSSPHWRYTATVTKPIVRSSLSNCGSKEEDEDECCVYLVAGQCRHNDPAAVYRFNWRLFV
jgi:hypothetical protein